MLFRFAGFMLTVFAWCKLGYAQHLPYASLIEYELLNQAGCLTFSVQADMVMYSNDEHPSQDSLLIDFGDGETTYAEKVQESVHSSIKTVRYRATHTYAGCGNFLLSVMDTFSISGANFSGAWNWVTQSQVSYNPLSFNVHSANVNEPFILKGIVGTAFAQQLHIADSQDGDSISFDLFEPFNLAGYFIPNGCEISPVVGS
jgi:hypothetical protein